MNKKKLKEALHYCKTESKEDTVVHIVVIIGLLEALLEEDKEEVKVKEKPQHKPTEENLGWGLSFDGSIFDLKDNIPLDLTFAFEAYKNNNWFPTKELAEKELDKRQAIARVKEYIAENFGVFEPDGGDDEQVKYTFYFNYNSNELDYVSPYCVKHYSPIG